MKAANDRRTLLYSSKSTKLSSGRWGWSVEELNTDTMVKSIIASGDAATKLEAVKIGNGMAREKNKLHRAECNPSLQFAEVNASHLNPIVVALRASDREKAAELFAKLVDSIRDIKSFEVALLRQKLFREAGIATESRRKVTA